ncbi:hypothetical protein LTR50_006451 [Elasticomyces elasticus]|nr:hypothetical protein LTR50_006451 [Elasticomyces elasticus]
MSPITTTTTTSTQPAEHDSHGCRIALVGAGTIGLSFAALHLSANPSATVTIHDTRPDLEEYVQNNLPGYLAATGSDVPAALSRLRLATSLRDAVQGADYVQEQGPENLAFKQSIWRAIEEHAEPDALFWSSTSGIPASAQSAQMRDRSRLLVVHPYNPPHIMPLLEVVPSPATAQAAVDRTLDYWRRLGRTPVVLKKECTGFVANRLAFALWREAIHLVEQGVVSVEECDAIVQSSMGPRWAVAGPFKSYHAGGGQGGLEAFLKNIGGTVQACWDATGEPDVGGGWEEDVCRQTREAYGVVDTGERDRIAKKVLEAVESGKGG